MFEKIVGNEQQKSILANNIKNNKISHSYIFSGNTGIGKFLLAKEYAKTVLCQGENKPCGKCDACITFEGNNNPDIVIIDEEDKSIKTETIKQMIKSVYEKPLKSNKKIYIINNSEKMTKEAQNSLLKTLEEPPEYVVIILITENQNLLLNTIKSRCTSIKFNGLTNDEIKQILKEKGFTDFSQNVFEFAEGSAKLALEVLEKKDIIDDVKEAFSNIENIDLIDFLKMKESIFKDKENVDNILHIINLIMIKKATKDIRFINTINMVEEAKDRIKKNANYDMTIDNLMFKIWEEVNG